MDDSQAQHNYNQAKAALGNSDCSDYEWSLEEHLDELRQRILASILFFIPCLAVGFVACPELILKLEALAPTGTIFFQLKPGELLFVYLKMSFVLSIILSLPFWLYQMNAFVSPGLNKKEKQISKIFLMGSPLLFVIGALFAYFIALKPLLNFLLGFGIDLKLVHPQYGLDYYISLVVAVIVIFALAFQLPILLFILAIFDLIDSKQLLAYWKQSIFASFVLAAVLTPTPDPINMGLLGIVLCGLYGFSILLIKLFGK